MTNDGRLTIGDLASRLNLSPAAVSYALNNRPGVSPETRARVQALAQELGWYPSSSARALSQARAGSIGVVLSRHPEMIGTESYYMQVISGIERVLIEADLSLMLRMVSPESGGDLGIYRRWAGERRVDGVILFDEQLDDPRIPLLESLRMPAVLQGGPASTGSVRSVSVDDDDVAHLIVDTFAALGHRKVTHITGPLRMVHERRRRAAVTERAIERNVVTDVIEGDYTLEGARSVLNEHLRNGAQPTAIACSNDLMAVGALRAVEEAGLRVPGDVSLISWDDSLLCSVSRPGISALDRHPAEYGERTARALLHTIQGQDDASDPVRPSVLVTRGTTGPAPGWLPPTP